MTRVVVLVIPKQPQGWQVKREGGERLVDVFTKESAENFASVWARGNAPCEVRVFGYDGKMEHTTSYD